MRQGPSPGRVDSPRLRLAASGPESPRQAPSWFRVVPLAPLHIQVWSIRAARVLRTPAPFHLPSPGRSESGSPPHATRWFLLSGFLPGKSACHLSLRLNVTHDSDLSPSGPLRMLWAWDSGACKHWHSFSCREWLRLESRRRPSASDASEPDTVTLSGPAPSLAEPEPPVPRVWHTSGGLAIVCRHWQAADRPGRRSCTVLLACQASRVTVTQAEWPSSSRPEWPCLSSCQWHWRSDDIKSSSVKTYNWMPLVASSNPLPYRRLRAAASAAPLWCPSHTSRAWDAVPEQSRSGLLS